MSYLVLARKSRPQRFAEVIGQKAVVRTLTNALEQNRVAHAIIFSGVRGTGKTTLARIMAKALNCTDRRGVEPCNECPSCREINEGASVDLQEVDGASNRGIEQIRELKERIRFQPSGSRFKIFIIDEVHMLTTEAFNALLKTLEEPPEHVYFMFATTELHKVPLTILSRCQRFELKRLSLRELREHFAALAAQEKVAISPQALDMVAREAAGSVRDGLSLLDQIFSYCGDKVDETDVQEVLGLVSRNAVADLGAALLRADLARALELLGGLQDKGVDLRRFTGDLLRWLRELLLCKLGPKTEAMLGLPEDELAALRELARPCSEAQLAALFNLVMDAADQRHVGRNPGLALELACIRAVQAAEITPTAELIARFDALLGDDAGSPLPPLPRTAEHVPVQAANVAPSPAPPPAPPQQQKQETRKQPEPTMPPQTAIPEEPPPPSDDLAPPPEASLDAAANFIPNPAPPVDEAPPPSETRRKKSAKSKTPPSTEQIRSRWRDFAHHVAERIRWMGLALEQAREPRIEDGALVLTFRDLNECIMLKERKNLEKLAELAGTFFGAPLSAKIEEEHAGADVVNPLTGRTRLEEEKALLAEPLVLTALEVLGGQVVEVRAGAPNAEAAPEQPGGEEARDGAISAMPPENEDSEED